MADAAAITDGRIAACSPLPPGEFRALFAGRLLGDLELRLTVEELEEARRDPGRPPFEPGSHHGEGFRVRLLAGLPRSGKSTRVRELGLPVLNPDTLRLCYYGKRFDIAGEKGMWDVARRLADRFRREGVAEIAIDATNATEARRAMWLGPYDGEVEAVRTPVEECVRRAHATGMPDLVPVIESMAAAWDLDGTYRD